MVIHNSLRKVFFFFVLWVPFELTQADEDSTSRLLGGKRVCTEIGPYVVLFLNTFSARRVTEKSSLLSFFFFKKKKVKIKSGLVDSEITNYPYFTTTPLKSYTTKRLFFYFRVHSTTHARENSSYIARY